MLEYMEKELYLGTVACKKRNNEISWYWTPEGYGITYFLVGYNSSTPLLEEFESGIESEFLYEYIIAIVGNEIENSVDSDMFAEIYFDLRSINYTMPQLCI